MFSVFVIASFYFVLVSRFFRRWGYPRGVMFLSRLLGFHSCGCLIILLFPWYHQVRTLHKLLLVVNEIIFRFLIGGFFVCSNNNPRQTQDPGLLFFTQWCILCIWNKRGKYIFSDILLNDNIAVRLFHRFTFAQAFFSCVPILFIEVQEIFAVVK